jgi:uncharacterized membrane protein
MKNIFVHVLRGISYILLPVGSYLAIWETNPLRETAIILALLVLPILLILFLGRPHANRPPGDMPTASKIIGGVIRKPTIKSLLLNLIPITMLIFIGLLPFLFWTYFVLVLTHPACGNRPLTDIFPILYCLINQ